MTSFTVPGVLVREVDAGLVPGSLVSHNNIYMLISSDFAGAPETPTLVGDTTIFENTFGNSTNTDSYPSVVAFFDQRPRAGLNVLNVLPYNQASLDTLAAPVADDVFTVTVDGTNYSYTAIAGDTEDDVLAALSALLVPVKGVRIVGDGMGSSVLSYKTQTIAVSATLSLGSASAASYPTSRDIADYLDEHLTPDLAPGIIIAPEIYSQSGLSDNDYVGYHTAIEALVADADFKWIHLVDQKLATGTATQTSYAELSRLERNLLSSTRGHSALYGPYVVSLADETIPASAVVAGLYSRSLEDNGLAQVPAGVNARPFGIKSLAVATTYVIQNVLNPIGVNLFRSIPQQGLLVWGARTLSTNGLYRYIHIRAILNVAIKSIFNTLQPFVFRPGRGATLANIKGSIASILELLRQDGALFGSTPQECYRIVVDETTNTPEQLDAGIVKGNVYIKPVAVAEFIQINLARVALAENFDEVISFTVSES